MVREVQQEIASLIEDGQFAKANEQLLLMYKEDKKNSEVLYLLGYIAFKTDDYDQAIAYLNKSLALNDRDYRTHQVLGQALGLKAESAGGLKSAMLLPKIRNAFQKALELNEQSLDALEGLFMFYLFAPGLAGGDMKKADEYAQKISRTHPARGLMMRALQLLRRNQPQQAMEAFDQATESGQNDADIQMRAARFFLHQKAYDKAASLFERYVALKPHDAAGYNGKGRVFLDQGRAEEALQEFDRALQLNYNFIPAHLNRAEALQKLRRGDEARREYELVIERRPKSPAAARAKAALAKK